MGVLVTWRLFTVQPAHPDPVVADMQGNAAWALQLRLGEQQQGLGCSTDGYGFGRRPSGRNVVRAEISVPRLPVRGPGWELGPQPAWTMGEKLRETGVYESKEEDACAGR